MKPIAKILVPMTGSDRDGSALATAFGLAEPFGAHVEAAFAYPDPKAMVVAGPPLATSMLGTVIADQNFYTVEAEKKARAMLAAADANRSVRSGERSISTCSFYRDMGSLPATILRRARLSDLVVFPSLKLPGYIDVIEAFLSVLTRVERPAVVTTEGFKGDRFRSIAIGWDGSKSAAKAVMAAVPFLKRADKVCVLNVAEAHSRPFLDGIEQYLALQGIAAMRKSARLGPPSVGDMLAQGAHEFGADLLVIGGYGHSHLRETFLGGATADILARAKMPIFLAH